MNPTLADVHRVQIRNKEIGLHHLYCCVTDYTYRYNHQ